MYVRAYIIHASRDSPPLASFHCNGTLWMTYALILYILCRTWSCNVLHSCPILYKPTIPIYTGYGLVCKLPAEAGINRKYRFNISQQVRIHRCMCMHCYAWSHRTSSLSSIQILWSWCSRIRIQCHALSHITAAVWFILLYCLYSLQTLTCSSNFSLICTVYVHNSEWLPHFIVLMLTYSITLWHSLEALKGVHQA